MTRIVIETVPTKDQRYPTLGDYYRESDTLRVRISEGFSPRAFACMVLHELVELFMCENDGIAFETIDTFDKAFEERTDMLVDAEPGDDPNCPYRKQHQSAQNLECIFADYLRLEWPAYQAEFDEICEKLDALKAAGNWGCAKPIAIASAHQLGRPEKPQDF